MSFINYKKDELDVIINYKAGELDVTIYSEVELGGIGMGVLENGIAYLTTSGLATACGIDVETLKELSSDWKNKKLTSEGKAIDKILHENEYYCDFLCHKIKHYEREYYIFPDIVCKALLEFYVFEYNSFPSESHKKEVQDRYRAMTRDSLRNYIYKSVGCSLLEFYGNSWKYYHDRVSILQNRVPSGYYIVFHEISGMIADLITLGVNLNPKVIPDISVGKCWATEWKNKKYSDKYGDSINCLHFYPEYYPQSFSNPQNVNGYPEETLHIFRKWFREVYLPTKLPKYILKQAKNITGGKEEASHIADSFK